MGFLEIQKYSAKTLNVCSHCRPVADELSRHLRMPSAMGHEMGY